MAGFKYNCDFCSNYGTDVLDLWRRHLKAHEFPCKHCTRVFYKLYNLKYHTQHVHKNQTWDRPVAGHRTTPTFSTTYWDGTQIKYQETKVGLYEYNYLINFKGYTEQDNESLHTRMIFIQKVLDDIVSHFKNFLVSKKDKIQLIFNSKPNLLAVPFATKFCNKHTFTASYLKDRASTLLNSNQSFVLDGNFHLAVKLYTAKTIEGGASLKNDEYFTALKKKRSVVFLDNYKKGHYLCFAKSLVIGIAKIAFDTGEISNNLWGDYRRQRNILIKKARQLQKLSKTPFNSFIKLEHIKNFDKILQEFQIIVLKGPLNNIIYSSSNKSEKKLYVLYYKNHYIPILNYRAFIGVRYICEFCDAWCSNPLVHHICSKKCFQCHHKKHENSFDVKIKCTKCDNTFYSKKCFIQHKKKSFKSKNKKSICDIFKFCVTCNCSHNIARCKPEKNPFL